MTQSPADEKAKQRAEEVAVDSAANHKPTVEQEEVQAESEPMSFNDLLALYESSQDKVKESYQQVLRAKAEVENMQRRSQRDISNARKFAIEGFVNDLIPVLDSLEQGMAIESSTDSEGMREGLELTMKLFVDAMTKHGVERLDPAGHPFNPEHHEAMSMVETSEVDPDHVMQVFQKGYLLNDRVVRPARVIVARGPTKPIDESA
jgi:molecular chaperone GrpE